MRIGLLGGSFNPAHEGHRHLARQALRRLRLDQVWLLVSPGNPLKGPDGMARHAARLQSAKRLEDGLRVLASGIEARLGTRYSLDTIRVLRRRFPKVRFVWLIGADILQQLPHWKGWTRLTRYVPFAVLPRPPYTLRALAGRAAHRLRFARHPARTAPVLATSLPPAWTFIPTPQNPISATALRAAGRGAGP